MKQKYVRIYIAFQLLKKAIQELDSAWNDLLDDQNGIGGLEYPKNWACFDIEKYYILEWISAQEKVIKSDSK